MLAPQPFYALSASEVLKLFREEKITVEKYARSLLRRVEERDARVKAWVYLEPERVLEQARDLDQVPMVERGPLHGVAVGIKDVMNTKDMPTEFGSPMYKGHQPGFDSSAVAILRAAGALIFGKTTTTEFTVANFGPDTANPHDLNRTPGGSSCGSAAAVADYHVPLSLGCQTGGSLIRPASFTGIFGFKPTYNAISVEGQKLFSPTFDTLGFFARSVEDLKLLADVYNIKEDNVDTSKDVANSAPGNITVALIRGPMWKHAGPGTVAAMDQAATILANKGFKVDDISLPSTIGDEEKLKRIQKVVMTGEAAVAFLREYRMDRTKLNPRIRQFVENSDGFTNRERIQASDEWAKIRAIADDVAAKYSVIITPSAVDEAPLGLDDMGSAIFNTLWTGLHMPVMSVPSFKGANGMPIGISLVAGRFQDQHLLSIAERLSEPLMSGGGWQFKHVGRVQDCTSELEKAPRQLTCVML